MQFSPQTAEQLKCYCAHESCFCLPHGHVCRLRCTRGPRSCESQASQPKTKSMSKRFEAASQFENYSARMCARGLLHRQNYSLSFSSFATNKETPSLQLQWQRNQSTQRVLPTKTTPLTARTCSYLLMESLGRAKLAKRHEHGSHGHKTAASQFENYSVRMCRRELLHQQNYSLSFSSFATNIETTHNTGGPINQPNLSCQLKQWQKRQEPVLRHGEPWPCKICKQT